MKTEPSTLARSAWRLVHADPTRARVVADQARALTDGGSGAGIAWAELTLGVCLSLDGEWASALETLARATHRFSAVCSRTGVALATAASARTLWYRGEYKEAEALQDRVREDGMALLTSTERAYFLNVEAGFHSSSGDSASALQLLAQAMSALPEDRDCGLQQVGLECNVAHELLELGLCDAALTHINSALTNQSIERQARFASVLRMNRLLCLLEIGAAERAKPDVRWLIESGAPYRPFDSYNGTHAVMILCALNAGDTDVVHRLLAKPVPRTESEKPDAEVYRAMVHAKLAEASGQGDQGLVILTSAVERCERHPSIALTPRVEQLLYRLAADMQEKRGNTAAALLLTKKTLALSAKRASRLVQPASAPTSKLASVGQRRYGPGTFAAATNGLSPSLQRTLDHLRRGMSNKEIARALGISSFTVRDNCSELYSRFGVNKRTELMALLGPVHTR